MGKSKYSLDNYEPATATAPAFSLDNYDEVETVGNATILKKKSTTTPALNNGGEISSPSTSPSKSLLLSANGNIGTVQPLPVAKPFKDIFSANNLLDQDIASSNAYSLSTFNEAQEGALTQFNKQQNSLAGGGITPSTTEKQQFKANEVKTNKDELAAYNRKRQSEINERIAKNAEAISIIRQNTVVDDVKGTITSGGDITPFEVETTNLNQYKDDLKKSVATQAANIILSDTDFSNFDPVKVGRDIIKISDPDRDAIYNIIEKEGRTLPGVQRAQLEKLGLGQVREFLESNPDIPNKDQALNAVNEREKDFDERNFELTAVTVRDKLSQYFYKKDDGGFFGLFGRSKFSKSALSEAVDDPELGLTEAEKKVAIDYVLPLEERIVGTNISRSGLLSSFTGALEKSGASMGNTFMALTDMRSEGDQAISALDPSGRFKPVENRTFWDKTFDGIGDMTGQVMAMGATGAGLGRTGLFIGSYLNAFDNYKQQAILEMPQASQRDRQLYAGTLSFLEGATEGIFNDAKAVQGLMTSVKPTVRELTEKFVNGEITTELAKETLQNSMATKIKQFGKGYGIATIENAAEESVMDIASGMASSVFGGQDFDILKTGKQAAETFLTTALYSPIVSGLAARGAVNQNSSQNAFMKSAIVDMARNPASYLGAVEDLQINNQITQQEANEKVALIKGASSYLQDIPADRNFDYPTTTSYLVHRLNEGILNEKLEVERKKSNPDQVRIDQLEADIKRSTEIRKGIYDGTVTVNDDLQEETTDEKKGEDLGINVIRPNEIFQPETTTIAPDENLVPETPASTSSVILPQSKVAPNIIPTTDEQATTTNQEGESQPVSENIIPANEEASVGENMLSSRPESEVTGQELDVLKHKFKYVKSLKNDDGSINEKNLSRALEDKAPIGKFVQQSDIDYLRRIALEIDDATLIETADYLQLNRDELQRNSSMLSDLVKSKDRESNNETFNKIMDAFDLKDKGNFTQSDFLKRVYEKVEEKYLKKVGIRQISNNEKTQTSQPSSEVVSSVSSKGNEDAGYEGFTQAENDKLNSELDKKIVDNPDDKADFVPFTEGDARRALEKWGLTKVYGNREAYSTFLNRQFWYGNIPKAAYDYLKSKGYDLDKKHINESAGIKPNSEQTVQVSDTTAAPQSTNADQQKTNSEVDNGSVSKVGFTEVADLNRMYATAKTKYGEKKAAAIYEAANRLVNPNKNTIVDIKSNGVVVKEGEKYTFRPFGNTDANSKKWTLYKGVDVTEQYAPQQLSNNENNQEGSNKDGTSKTDAAREGIDNSRLQNSNEQTQPISSKENISNESQVDSPTQATTTQQANLITPNTTTDAVFEPETTSRLLGAEETQPQQQVELPTMGERDSEENTQKPSSKKVAKLSSSLRSRATKIRNEGYLPAWAKMKDDDNVRTMGFGGKPLDEAIARSFELVADAIDAGVEVAEAINRGFGNLRDYYAANTKSFDEDALRTEFEGEVNASLELEQPNLSGITLASTEETRTEFGLGDYYQKQQISDEELNSFADKAIANKYNIEGLISRLEGGAIPNSLETIILKKFKATLDARVANNPSDANLKLLKRVVRTNDVARSDIGRALRAGQGDIERDETLGDYFVTEMESAGTDILTDEQKEKVRLEFEKIQEANKTYEQALNKLEAENSKLKARANIDKAAKTYKRKSKSHEEFVKERQSIADNIKEKWAKAANDNTLTAVPIPYAKQLYAIAPDVARLTRSLVEEGVVNLTEVVDAVHDILKEGISEITKRDVQDLIAGEYNARQKTKNEYSARVKDLRDEAALLNKLDDLENGEIPTTEKAKIERNRNITELRSKVNALKAKILREDREANTFYPEEYIPERSKLKAIAKRNETEAARIQKLTDEGNYAPDVKPLPLLDDKNAKKNFPELFKKALDSKDKLIKTKIDREIRLLQQAYQNRSKAEKIKDFTIEILNVPRTIMSSMDFSAPLRQGIIPTISHPRLAAAAFTEMFRQAVSQKRFDRWFYDLREQPDFPIMEKSGLYVADPHDPKLSAKEEQFMNNLAEKIPLIGRMIKGSERAYVSYLNKMRVDLFKQGEQVLVSRGMTIDNAEREYKKLASWVNNSTGRGGLIKPIDSAAPILNSVFFSPRLIASRLNLLNPIYYYNLPPVIRKMALADMAKFVIFGLSVLAIASIGDDDDDEGVSVEVDPRSTDFGKIKNGDTRYDIWGGFQQYARLIGQLLSGESKSVSSGKIQKVDGTGRFGTDRGDILGRFFRGKFAPIPATITDLVTGRTIMGEKILYQFTGETKKKEITLTDEFQKILTPLVAADTYKAIESEGIKSLGSVWLPSVFGIGVQTYSPPKK